MQDLKTRSAAGRGAQASSSIAPHFFRAVGRTMRCHKLGTLLVSAGLVTDAELRAALTVHQKTGEPLGRVLVREGTVSAVQLYRKLAEQWCLKASAASIAMMMMAAPPAHASQERGGITPQFQMAAASVNPSALRPRSAPALFGSQEVRSNDISAFRKWTGVMGRFESEMQSRVASSPRVLMWKAELRNLKGMSEREMVEGVNSYVNNVRYIEDSGNYGKSDYWATPAEFFAKGGDCEDFAIAKYASLRALGFSSDRLRIVVVQDLYKNLKHAVLAVYTEQGIMILDNQNKRVVAASDTDRYQPIFSINSTSWWLHRYADS
jgi:predicted transglutaminase-like cysteine proteinase